MKKVFIVLGLCFFLSMLFVVEAMAQLPKEFTGTGISAYSGTFKAVAMGKERVQITYESLGVVINDAGESIYHNNSVRCLGSFHAIKGVYEDDNGFCVQTRPDGDQIFMTTKNSGTVGRGGKGTYTIVGGTGKMTGIQGGGEYTMNPLRPAAEGTFQGYNRVKGSYKLP